jgi:hypothetical protein
MELYRAADLCVVSSLHDGMNLVAKEFVAARDDEQGVLVLSTFAGASRELLERMRRMREAVRSNNVFRWAGKMLLDAARLRKREGLLDAARPTNDHAAGTVDLATAKRLEPANDWRSGEIARKGASRHILPPGIAASEEDVRTLLRHRRGSPEQPNGGA